MAEFVQPSPHVHSPIQALQQSGPPCSHSWMTRCDQAVRGPNSSSASCGFAMYAEPTLGHTTSRLSPIQANPVNPPSCVYHIVGVQPRRVKSRIMNRYNAGRPRRFHRNRYRWSIAQLAPLPGIQPCAGLQKIGFLAQSQFSPSQTGSACRRANPC